MKQYATEIRKTYDTEYVKVFLLDEKRNEEVKSALVDMASTLKRNVPGSRGGVDKFYHRRSHLTIVVAERV
jgi:ribulose bisphosphate carboxylase small subunit